MRITRWFRNFLYKWIWKTKGRLAHLVFKLQFLKDLLRISARILWPSTFYRCELIGTYVVARRRYVIDVKITRTPIQTSRIIEELIRKEFHSEKQIASPYTFILIKCCFFRIYRKDVKLVTLCPYAVPIYSNCSQ